MNHNFFSLSLSSLLNRMHVLILIYAHIYEIENLIFNVIAKYKMMIEIRRRGREEEGKGRIFIIFSVANYFYYYYKKKKKRSNQLLKSTHY